MKTTLTPEQIEERRAWFDAAYQRLADLADLESFHLKRWPNVACPACGRDALVFGGAYERANLVRHLRGEANAPQCPVMKAAIDAWSPGDRAYGGYGMEESREQLARSIRDITSEIRRAIAHGGLRKAAPSGRA